MSEAIQQKELSQEKPETGSLDHRATEISNFFKNKADGLMYQVDAIKNHFKKEAPKKETDEEYVVRIENALKEEKQQKEQAIATSALNLDQPKGAPSLGEVATGKTDEINFANIQKRREEIAGI